eukprot:g71496.t1
MSQRLSLLAQRYRSFSARRPHTVAAFTSSAILSFADISAQMIVHPPSQGESFDWNRTLAVGVFGFVYYGGPCKWLYLRYERWFPKRPLITTLVDVGVHTPFLLLPSFYAITGSIKGSSGSEIVAQFKREWFEASTGSFMFWFPLCAFNFSMVPLQFRILTVSVASFLHKTWLSALSNRERHAARGMNVNFQLIFLFRCSRFDNVPHIM